MEQYENAMTEFRKISSEFRQAQERYRARLINDAEFLAVRERFTAAHLRTDVAEAVLLFQRGEI